MSDINILLRKICVAPIRVYQRFISPVLPPACRFRPTCSEYAAEAVLRYGVITGGLLALRRLSRCHPWGGSGYDPVPEKLSGFFAKLSSRSPHSHARK